MRNYLNLLQTVLDEGHARTTRNGPTLSLFGPQLRFDLTKGFPAVTTKRLYFRSVVVELLWFLQGYSDNNELNRLGCRIWNANGDADYWTPKAAFPGDLGRIYGVQWRTWRDTQGNEHDQISELINSLTAQPYGRRHIVNAWNPGELDQMALPPCHMFFQCYVRDGYLDLKMYQRSADLFLGVPFNIASYALLVHILGRITGLKPGQLIISFGDVHIYDNHKEAVLTQLTRTPFDLPTLFITDEWTSLSDFDTKHISGPESVENVIRLDDYLHHKPIKAPMAV